MHASPRTSSEDSSAVEDAAGAAALFERRRAATLALSEQAAAVAHACHAMAARFHRGGQLIVFGSGGACTDAQHIAVEFVHPVLVGKRALPAVSLTSDVATVTGIARQAGYEEVFAHQLRVLGAEADIALGLSADGHDPSVARGLGVAAEMGMLTAGLVGGRGGPVARAASHVLLAPSEDPQIVKEVQVTAYHVLWELVHVFLDHPGVLDAEPVGQ